MLGLCWPMLALCWPYVLACWPISGLSWPILGAMLAHLGAMLTHLEAYLRPCWPIVSHKLRKMGKKGKSTKHRKTRDFLAAGGVCGKGRRPLSPTERRELPYGNATARGPPGRIRTPSPAADPWPNRGLGRSDWLSNQPATSSPGVSRHWKENRAIGDSSKEV